MPAEARFRWQAEGLWAVESFLEQATEAERREFAEAVKRGDLELPANLTNVLTGLCHPEELARWTDASRRLKRRYGIETSPVAMHTDIPGLAWPTVAALAQAGVRYFSSGPNYMPNLKPDGGDRIGSTLVEHGDRPFWWVSPSGRERLLMWVAGRGYSWFHGANLGHTTDSATRGILDYSRELARERLPVRDRPGALHGRRGQRPGGPEAAGVRGELERALRDTAARPRLRAGPLRGLRAAIRSVSPREAGRPDPVLGGRCDLERGRGDPGAGRGPAAGPGRGAVGDDRPGRVPARAGRGGVAPAPPVARAHLGRRGERLGAGPRRTWWPSGSTSGLSRSRPTAGRGRSSTRPPSRQGRPSADPAVAIVNTLARPRGGLVLLPADLSRAGDRVVVEGAAGGGRAAPSQRLADGSLAVAVTEVPARGGLRLRVASGRPERPAGRRHRLGHDARERRPPRRAGPGGRAPSAASSPARAAGWRAPPATRSSPGRRASPATATSPAATRPGREDAGPVTITVEEPGPLVAVLRAEGPAPGAQERRDPLPPRGRIGPARGRAPPRQARRSATRRAPT